MNCSYNSCLTVASIPLPELRMIAATSKPGNGSVKNGRENPPRSGCSSSAGSVTNGYVIIESPGGGKITVKEGEQFNGSISRSECSSVASEATTGSSQTSGKVHIMWISHTQCTYL